MKTTLDLPDNLLQRLKIRAVQERRPLKRLVADLLAQALEAPVLLQPVSPSLSDGIELNERGYPVFRCRPDAPHSRMSANKLVELEQEVLEAEDMQRAGVPL